MGKTQSRLFVVAVLAALLALPLALEALSVMFAQGCGTPTADPGCYPWGTEGPAAGIWRYESKANYLVSGILPLIVEVSIIAVLLRNARKSATLARWQAALVAVAIAAPLVLLLI